MKQNYDLEERLIDFSVSVIEIVDKMPNSKAGNHLASQLVRSGTSVALNYGEAQAAESRRDFVHKMKVVLKELRESFNNLRIIKKALLFQPIEALDKILDENNQLISIFVKSIETAESKQGKNKY
ncbi:four helix bundle protein [Reichenbachiella ulvae]|uniref:Four helix bundle protein n=1 Tax=Reichenbachiella ulvae TaxID=2980104 RepID=A0ABT3D0F2_9BACT|nr:four helix bundle protein [Reichenbachiella ulvae]MCV9388933.1 four helix bundle protein [Reichenbachiella ulvae]